MKPHITRSIIGIAIIAVGAGFVLENLNLIEFGQIVGSWWPLAIIAAGILVFISDTKSYLWSLLIIGIGVAFQLRELGITDINPWQFFWPFVIIAVGISILIRRGSPGNVSKSDRDDLTAILGGTEQKNRSENFKGSRLTSIMGGAKLDLRKAIIKKEATIEVFTLLGGIELIVPRDITVRNQTSAILGGVEDKTEQEAGKDAPILYITGDVILAGIEIKN